MKHTKEEIEIIASVCHEANAAWCRGAGDTSQPSWADAPLWQRESAILGVLGAIAGNSPEEAHESWTDVKLKDGWVYGALKSPEAKTHPCLGPYDQLPPAQRRKDALFVAVVNALK